MFVFLGFVLFAFAVCLVYDDDGLLDYVQVLDQFSFVASIVMALNSNLQLLLFAMSYSVLNDLAEAMKALDGKKDLSVVPCNASYVLNGLSPPLLCFCFRSGGVLFLVLVAVD